MATTSNTYTGNGSNKLFSITFPYLDTSDVDVYLNGTLQTITTQYTFANATTVEFVAAPANGATVKLDRSTDDATLQATFFPGSSIKAADLNADFDQTLYVVQEINNKAVKIDDPLYVNKTYVDNLALAGNVPDGDRGDITVSATGTVWTIDSGLPASRSSFTQAGTGATARTVDSKLKDVVSVKDFGAVGDGIADDTAAIQAALSAAKSVFIPPGTYLISSMLQVFPTNALNFSITGVKGKSTLKATGNNAILGPAGDFYAEFAEISGITFTSSTGGQGTGIYAATPWYISHWTIRECDFNGKLAIGIDGCLIGCEIARCTFGLYESGFAFKAIRSIGTVSPLRETNHNVIRSNEFAFSRTVDYTIHFKWGLKVIFEHNIFEQNQPTNSLIWLEGILYPCFDNNWFEANTGSSLIKTSLFNGSDVTLLAVENCLFNTVAGPSSAVIDFDNTFNKNIVFNNNLVAGGSVPLTTAGAVFVQRSGNRSTNSGFPALPSNKAEFLSGIKTTDIDTTNIIASGVVTGAIHRTTTGSVSVTFGTPVTLYTFPTLTNTAMYLVSAARYANDAANFSAYAVVATDLNTGRLILNTGSVGVTLSLLGLVLTVTNSAGGTYSVGYTITRIA